MIKHISMPSCFHILHKWMSWLTTEILIFALILLLAGELFQNTMVLCEESDETQLAEDDVKTDKRTISSGNCIEMYPCEPCDKLEQEANKAECSITGYRRISKCDGQQEPVFSSCPNGSKSFWMFELVWLVIGMVFGTMTMFRKRHLDRLVKERIMEQIQNTA
ncbi:Protein JTB [Holothuria leucospilota]|uniref:Protein JTB n=1 Tax=Holothuria leucospilota TaxID=206669 RepID=A0A9Q1BN42_HOLLE|nr:Protein JTB [Holothuria leucospilota]